MGCPSVCSSFSAKTATGSGSKATEAVSAGRPSRSREQNTVSSSVSVVGPSSEGVSGAKGPERHRSRSGERSRLTHGSDRCHDSPSSHHSSRHDSGRREIGEWAQPTSSGGSSSRRQADSTDAPGSSRVSARVTDVRPSGSSTHSHHHHKTSGDRRSLSSSSSRASVDRRSLFGHHQDYGRHESSERSGSSYVSRQEVQLSPAVSQSPERRTSLLFLRRLDQKPVTDRQVWRVQQKWTTQQQWWVRWMLWTASRWRPSRWRSSRGRVSRWRVSKGAHHGNRWRARDHGWPSRSCRPNTPSGVSRGRPSTWWWRPSRCHRSSTPYCREHSSGRTLFILVIGCQRSHFSVNAQEDQPDSTTWLHVYVDVHAT